mmetsp:Transcript_71137/g.167680  ORF Transcript_71137/g.167680 Transcript_71137/m.167680 type:complete len:217 (+) Transcript_71137:525-1175(+)
MSWQRRHPLWERCRGLPRTWQRVRRRRCMAMPWERMGGVSGGTVTATTRTAKAPRHRPHDGVRAREVSRVMRALSTEGAAETRTRKRVNRVRQDLLVPRHLRPSASSGPLSRHCKRDTCSPTSTSAEPLDARPRRAMQVSRHHHHHLLLPRQQRLLFRPHLHPAHEPPLSPLRPHPRHRPHQRAGPREHSTPTDRLTPCVAVHPPCTVVHQRIQFP